MINDFSGCVWGFGIQRIGKLTLPYKNRYIGNNRQCLKDSGRNAAAFLFSH
jgi:hypothetical protein